MTTAKITTTTPTAAELSDFYAYRRRDVATLTDDVETGGDRGAEWASRFEREAVVARLALDSLTDESIVAKLDPEGYEADLRAEIDARVAAGEDYGNIIEAELAAFECAE